MQQQARVRLARDAHDVEAAWRVLRQLRPHLSHEEFMRCLPVLQAQGYTLALLEAEGRVVAVTGFREMDTFAHGPMLYMDDLVTDEASRGQGHGAQLLAWLKAEAARRGRGLHLDSGLQRGDAHRFYAREGMQVTAYHYGATATLA